MMMGNQLFYVVLFLQVCASIFGRPTDSSDNANNCIVTCETIQDGDYQSCDGCHMFVTCSGGSTLKEACPPGLIWDDTVKNCEMRSQTCNMDDTIEFMTMQNGMDKVDDYTQMPEHFNLRFNIRDTEMVLNLTKNSHILADFPIYIADNGVVTEVDIPSDDMFVMYGDKDAGASVLVHRNTEDPEGESYLYFGYIFTQEGLFTMDDGEYFLQPTRVNSQNVSDDIVGGPYMVRKMQPTQPDMEFGASEVRGKVQDGTEERDNPLDNSKLPRGFQKYEVEVLLFLDNAIYNKWYKLSKKRTSYEKEAEAVRNIRFYYSHVMNGVDLRYNSIEDSSMEIYFKVNAMYIAKTGRDSPWTEYNRRDYYFTEAYDSLDDFEAWLHKTKDTLPPFDLAALLTGYYLYNGQRSDGSLRTIGGLADIEGVCTYTPVFYGASISYENGLYGTTQTVTHEMGHNLGAYHDGNTIHAAECSGSNQYIMASAPGGITDRNYKNGLKFSHCSIRNFKGYLNYLTMENRNCLLTSETHPTDGENTDILAGQRFPPDQQCQIIYGSSSYYCGGGQKDSLICRELWCYRADTKRCVTSSEQRAFEGTTCGNKMWCEKSDCVFNNKAPEAPDYCIYGDYKDPYQPSGQTCPEIISERPWNCYREDYGNECCESCGMIRDDTREGCEFGDHSQCSGRESWHCYDDVTRQECCLFCDAFYNKDAIGCEYGNRGTQCDDIEDFHCYTQDDTCCATCAQRKRDTFTPGCEYGDKQRWCRDIRGGHECYHGSDDICCETCNKFKTDDPACPYGDKNEFCRREQCTNRQYNSTCCETCKDRSRVDSTPTRTPTVPRPDDCTDRPSYNCPSINRRDCYTQSETCCATCTPMYNSNQPGCEYGDKISWCARYVRENGVEIACQSDFVRRECCESCSAMPATRPPLAVTTPSPSNLCPEGNRANWCVASNFFAGYCYSDQTRETCCMACSQAKTGPPGCDYGDKAGWCANFVSQDMARACQRRDVKEQCCLSCMGLGTGPVPSEPTTTPGTVIGNGPNNDNCPDGDKATWCEATVSRHPGTCYNSNTRITCCASCSKYRTTIAGCTYGDKYSWCKPEHCLNNDEYHRTSCCKTCAHLN